MIDNDGIIALYAPIAQIFDLIDAHQPVFGRVRFFHCFQFEILVADFGRADTIVARWLAAFGVNLRSKLYDLFVIRVQGSYALKKKYT